MTREEYYKEIGVIYVEKNEITLCTWTLRTGQPHSKIKYIYGRIKLEVGAGTKGVGLTFLESEIEKVKEEMYGCLLKEYQNQIDDVYYRYDYT